PGQKAIRGEHSTMAKCASSAMLHLGLSRNANELYGAYGHNLSFDELEWLANWCFVRGQNFLIPHAFFYSIRGPRFEERPPDVGPNSTWWNDYKPYADACRRLSWLNTGSKQVCDIAVLCEATWLPDRMPEVLYRNQRDFNYLEVSHLWGNARVSANGVQIAGMEYKAVLLDSLSSIPAEAAPSLKTLAAAGRLVLWNNPAMAALYKGSINVIGKEELIRVLGKLAKSDVSLKPASGSIRYRHVIKDGIHYYMLFNEEENTVRTNILIPEKGACYKVNPYTAEAAAFMNGSEAIIKPHEMLLLEVKPTSELNSPEGLMTEFIRDPEDVVIKDLSPEFSWIVPANIRKQKAYQVLVSQYLSALENNHGDAWDSGRKLSGQSTEVEFGNGTLKAGTCYYWKVRIWNEKDIASEYSEVQSFVTGNSTEYSTTGNKLQSPLNSPEKIKMISAGHYLADFGKDAFGTIILRMDAPSETTLTIHLGEKLAANGSIDRNPGGSIRYSKASMTVKPGMREYVLKLPKDARNTSGAAVMLPDSCGVVTPFRYCEVENYPSELRPSEISRKTYHYYFEEDNSSFTSSDTLLNQIWDLCKYSIKATSFAGLYIDGDRERIPYEADAYINQLGHYYTDREYSMARRTNEYFIDHPTWPTEWLLHTVPMFYNDYMFTGNLESARANYEKLREKTLYRLADPNGLISVKNLNDEIMKLIGFRNQKERLRDIVDWPPAQKDTGWKLVTPEGERDGYDMVETNTMVNAFYYRSLLCMAKLAEALGKKDDAQLYNGLGLKVIEVFNKELLDKSTGV
ncbi:MAG TPA: family 78 glycoside hydrolase catalytic domain, partial [Bacteroidales bacterium]|nr:family 78 glycoside hydrolase catalytic domain [Bacteroidales bacterium]